MPDITSGYSRRQWQARDILYIPSVSVRYRDCEGEPPWPGLSFFPMLSRKARPQSAFGRKLASVFSLLRDVYIYSDPGGNISPWKNFPRHRRESHCWPTNPTFDPAPRAERRINNIDITNPRSIVFFLPAARTDRKRERERPIRELDVAMWKNRLRDTVLQLNFRGNVSV